MAEVDHIAEFRRRIDAVAAFQGKPKIRNLVGPPLDDLNNIERILLQLFFWASLDSAVGVNLQRIGDLVAVENPGGILSDEVYRAFVRAGALARLSRAQRDSVVEIIDGVATVIPGILDVARAMQVRAPSDSVQIQVQVPFTILIVIPGLLGVERTLAKQILLRAIGATDRLFLFGPPEGADLFTWNGTLAQGWNAGVWGDPI